MKSGHHTKGKHIAYAGQARKRKAGITGLTRRAPAPRASSASLDAVGVPLAASPLPWGREPLPSEA